MVNTGSVSRGCELCRQRKIRCDETRPACIKCTKYGRVCPGYREIATLSLSKKPKKERASKSIWKHQQASKSAPGNLQQQPDIMDEEEQEFDFDPLDHLYTLKTENSSQYDLALSQSASPASLDRRSHSPTYSDVYSNIDQAICCLFNSRAFAVCAVTDPEVDSVGMAQEMYQNTAPGSCLDISTRAAALANLSNRVDRVDIHMNAQRQYGLSLQALNATLQNEVDRLEDETLLSMLMIRFCEFFFALRSNSSIFSPKSHSSDTWLTHLGGALAILRMRGIDQLTTPQGRWLFDITFRSEVCKMLWSNSCPDDYLCKLEDQADLTRPRWTYPLISFYRYYFRNVLYIRAQVKKICDAAPNQPFKQTSSEVASLVQVATDLDTKLAVWEQQHPQFDPMLVSTPVRQTIGLRQDLTSLYFTNPTVHIYRTRLQFIQMKLHECLIAGLSATLEALESQLGRPGGLLQVTSSTFASVDKLMRKHVAVVQLKAAELLASMAYALGDVDETGNVVGTAPTSATSVSTGPSTPRSVFASAPPVPTIALSDPAGWEFEEVEGEVRNYPSRLRNIEVYVHMMNLQQGANMLPEDTAEGARCAGQRIVEELRCS